MPSCPCATPRCPVSPLTNTLGSPRPLSQPRCRAAVHAARSHPPAHRDTGPELAAAPSQTPAAADADTAMLALAWQLTCTLSDPRQRSSKAAARVVTQQRHRSRTWRGRMQSLLRPATLAAADLATSIRPPPALAENGATAANADPPTSAFASVAGSAVDAVASTVASVASPPVTDAAPMAEPAVDLSAAATAVANAAATLAGAVAQQASTAAQQASSAAARAAAAPHASAAVLEPVRVPTVVRHNARLAQPPRESAGAAHNANGASQHVPRPCCRYA